MSLERKLMAIGAHADDIELDVGGTLLKYRDSGYEVVYVMTTNNMSGSWYKIRPDGSIERNVVPYSVIMPQRKREASAGAEALGTIAIHLDYPQRHYIGTDGCFVQVNYGAPLPAGVPAGVPNILMAHEDARAVERVKDLILEHHPEAILSHGHLGDNLEHIASCLLVTKAYRRATAEGYTGMLLYWHDIAATTFRENYCQWDTHIDVSAFWEQKLALVAMHACQKPAVERLDFAPWGSACGCERAEVFSIAAEGTPPLYYTEFQAELYRNR